MKRSFNFPFFLILTIGALIPDLMSILLKMLIVDPRVPYDIRQVLGQTNTYPWQGVAFALSFGCAYLIASRLSVFRQVHMHEVLVLAIVLPMAQLFLPLIAAFTDIYLKSLGIPYIVVGRMLYAGALAIIAKQALFLEYATPAVITTALVGGGGSAVSLIDNVPFKPDMLWCTLVGMTMAFFLARKT